MQDGHQYRYSSPLLLQVSQLRERRDPAQAYVFRHAFGERPEEEVRAGLCEAHIRCCRYVPIGFWIRITFGSAQTTVV